LPDIFISYAQIDNRDIEAVTYEVPNAIDHFIAVYKHERRISDERLPEVFFRDHWSIEAGDRIPERIQNAIDECAVMLAFYSPSYFKSLACLMEWREFREAQDAAGEDSQGHPRKLLIPIEVKPVAPDQLEKIDVTLSEEWYEDLVTARGRKRTITSKILLDAKDSEPLAKEINELANKIEAHIDRQKGTSPDQRSWLNVLPIKTAIERDTMSSPELLAEVQRGREGLRYNQRLPVCVLYAGGTVGMVRKADSDQLHADYEMAPAIHAIVQPMSAKLTSLPFDMVFFQLAEPIDSSNVRAANWVTLARLIHEQMNNFQGFVILHGTNTLAYTASALSFLLNGSISKPVVLTGAEVPLSNPMTDAVHNMENAIRAAAPDSYGGPLPIPEVCVFWNNHLYRGNRIAKKFASDRSEGFHTPNMPVPLATLANDRLEVDYQQILQAPADLARPVPPIVDVTGADVAILFIHPEMDFEQINSQFARPPHGLILLSYGPGNVPEDPRFIEMIERLISEGTIVANVTQCPYGRVELKLFETSAKVFDLGVVDGYDMTLEAAYTKLLWAIARYAGDNRHQTGVQASIKAHFQENLAGEMSASVYSLHWPADRFSEGNSGPYRVSDSEDFRGRFSRLDITEAFVRLEGMRFPDGVDKARVNLFYGPPPVSEDDTTWDNLLATFEKSLTEEERGKRWDKNLEVTHTFRKLFMNTDFQISIGLESVRGVKFNSVRLVVYTKGARRRDA
jgi:L-asparaginase